MKDYSNYTSIDFVLDKDFQEWILHPDENSHAYWKEVILLHPDRQGPIRKAADILRSLKFRTLPISEIPEEKILQGIITKIHQDQEKALVQPLPPSRSPRHYHFPGWQKIAASATLILGLSWMLYFYFSDANTQRIQTAYGETREILLPDSSSVVLNANSILEFSSGWNKAVEREVWLNGEAYFRVAKVAANSSSKTEQSHIPAYQKFVVHTENLDVVVLGTSFNVNQRREKTQVVLTEGKVEVMINDEQRSVALAPGELLEYIPLRRSIAKAVVNPEVYSSWRTHQLIFDGVPLTQVAQRLEEIFGYEVVCREEVRDYVFKGTVPSDDIEVSLEVIQNAFGIKVIKNTGQIIFSK